MAELHRLDLNWTGRPRSIAACLIQSNGQAALVDPGPASTLETLRAALLARGLSVAHLSAILLTHIHMDHAGATGALLRENPRLPVYVHEKGAPHMADPSKLAASAKRLYGDHLQRLFGDFLPVPAENLRPLAGGETIEIGARKLTVLYTPGHASHHVTYFDSSDGLACVGDTAGIRIEGHSYLLPATPPPDIDLELWNASLDRILERRPARLFLSHFGFVSDPAEHIARYREALHGWGAIIGILLRAYGEEGAQRAFVEQMSDEIRRSLSPADAEHYLFNGGLELSWMGLARYWRKQSAAPSPAR